MSGRYDRIGIGYSCQRRADHRILRMIRQALGECASVLNVGAGTGSYEPTHIPTIAVEPSVKMIQQRINRSNVVQGVAEALPWRDGAFDASLAVLTLHHWADLGRGLEECARSSRRMVAILTWDPSSPGFWLTQNYFPEILEFDRSVFPALEEIRKRLGPTTVVDVPVPADCIDGFLGAYWQRPEAYLQEKVRFGMSSFSRVRTPAKKLKQLQADIESGVWHEVNRDLLVRESLDLGYRLVTAELH